MHKDTAMIKNVCCRFAPAPTGSLHLGSVHTALFSWLFAYKHQGRFIIRFEDSDQAVSSSSAIKSILSDLKWLGLLRDETEIYYQSERRKQGVYLVALNKLLNKGLLTKKPCSEGTAYQYNPPENTVIVSDLLRSPITVERSCDSASQLTSFIIIRADGWPLYNFACVVDDIDMRVTHVIRGDDILASTAKQISLYNAMNKPVPVFAHLPKIQDEDGKPLAKRRGSKSVDQFKKEGYLPEAIINYLALIGWSSPSGKELLTLEQIIDEFDLQRVNLSSARLDMNKLRYINGLHIRNLPTDELSHKLLDYLGEKSDLGYVHEDWLLRYCSEYAPRSQTLAELSSHLPSYLDNQLEYTWDLFSKHLNYSFVEEALGRCSATIECSQLDSDDIIVEFRGIAQEYNISFRKLAQCLRVALLNSVKTPDLKAILFLLGKDKSKTRLNVCIQLLKSSEWKLICMLTDFTEKCHDFRLLTKVSADSITSLGNSETFFFSRISSTLCSQLQHIEEVVSEAKARIFNSRNVDDAQ